MVTSLDELRHGRRLDHDASCTADLAGPRMPPSRSITPAKDNWFSSVQVCQCAWSNPAVRTTARCSASQLSNADSCVTSSTPSANRGPPPTRSISTFQFDRSAAPTPSISLKHVRSAAALTRPSTRPRWADRPSRTIPVVDPVAAGRQATASPTVGFPPWMIVIIPTPWLCRMSVPDSVVASGRCRRRALQLR